MKQIKALLIMVGFLFSFPSFALIEIKGGYAINSGPATSMNNTLNASALCTAGGSTCKGIVGSAGLTADVVFSPPMTKFGFGVRYQTLSSKASAPLALVDFTYTMARTALLVNYRLINTLFYLGPIATVGVSHTSNLNVKVSGANFGDVTTSTNSSYSIGLEGGAKLGLFMFGAEAGLLSLASTNLRTSGNGQLTWGSNPIDNVSMSGLYVNAMVGINF